MEHSKKFLSIQQKLTDLAKILDEVNKEKIEILKNMGALYENTIIEINEGKDLDELDESVTKALQVVEVYLKDDRGYDKLRNELFYLKYLIAEKR